MAIRPETLPRDLDRLIEMVLPSEGKIEALQETIAKLRTIIFGARSEKSAVIVAEQLSLGLGEADADAAAPSPANDDGPAENRPQATPKVYRIARGRAASDLGGGDSGVRGNSLESRDD